MKFESRFNHVNEKLAKMSTGHASVLVSFMQWMLMCCMTDTLKQIRMLLHCRAASWSCFYRPNNCCKIIVDQLRQ